MATDQDGAVKLGTFAGVFTPSILTILGIILFLRLGYVVGNAGLGGALAIIGIATLISVFTSISLAAISTNIEVKGGGDYFLISRTLGVEFGGALGIVLFLAQSVSVAFYAIGFAEVVAGVLGLQSTLATQAIALIALAALFGLAWAGADVATRFQFVIMAVLFTALASFFLGTVEAFDSATATAAFAPPPEQVGFWVIFGIFFPAVTGFTQGVSMSGDLKDPSRSLPLGTFLAVVLSTVVYVVAAILLAGTTPQAELVGDTGQAMEAVALFGPLITLGVVAATLSSAMASFLGAPRILQSLASDRIFPVLNPFSQGVGPSSNPRRAVLVTAGIAVGTIGLGSLNVIAPVVAMFFLVSYGLLNYATYFEARAKSPSFRPRFRFFNKWLSLIGALLCLGAMLAINAVAGGVSVLVLFAIYRYLDAKKTPERWADASHAHYFQRAKESVAALASEIDHPRNWRPQILAFSADPTRRARLLQFAKWVEGDSGLIGAFRVVQGEGIEKRRELAEEDAALRDQIAQLELDVYGRAVLAADGLEALPVIVQSFGLGRIQANTVLFGWPETSDPERRDAYVSALREIARLGVNVLSLSSDARKWKTLEAIPEKQRRLDVIWTDDDTGRLALLAAYLCTRTPFWEKAKIRAICICPTEDNTDEAGPDLEAILSEARISADVETLVSSDVDDLVATCMDASMVLVPMRIRENQMLDTEGRDLDQIVVRLPLTAAVMAGAPIHLVTQPDSGRAAALAEAEEDAERARQRLALLERRLAEGENRLRELSESGPTSTEYEEMLEAEERALDEVARRILKARARVELTQALFEKLLAEQR